MKSYKKAIVAWNQLLAFSPLLASTKKSENIFWPGCAASKLSPTIILKTYQTLRETMPDIGISTWCCASPTFSVGSEKAKHRRHVKLTTHIEKCGIKSRPDHNAIEKGLYMIVETVNSFFRPRLEAMKDALERGII